MAKSKFQKKKDREREVRKKILARREAHRNQEKENAKFDAEEKAVRPRQRPIRNEELYAARRMRELEIRMQLEHNMELLKNLQKEYEEELKKREEYIATLKNNCEQCEAGVPYVDVVVPPEDQINEDGTLKEDIFNDPPAGNGCKPVEDKPSLVEKATEHLAKVEENARRKQGKARKQREIETLVENKKQKEEFHQHLRELEKK